MTPPILIDALARAVALARVAEARLRSSKRATRLARRTIAALAKVSPEARALVRLRLMKLV